MMNVHVRRMHSNKLMFGLFFLTAFGSDSQMAPVAAGNPEILAYGSGRMYRYETSVTLNEPSGGKGKDVGYRVLCDASVGVIWQSPGDNQNKLLEFRVINPKLFIRSRKAPTPEGFVQHTSYLDNAKNFPYLVHWEAGRINEIFFDREDEASILDLKRGISSLFQFQLLDVETKERDASGQCSVSYRTLNQFSFTKTKTDCLSRNGVPFSKNLDPILDGRVNSSRTSTYVLSEDLSFLRSVKSSESHELRLPIKREVGGSVSALQKLDFIDTKVEVDLLKSNDLNDALKIFENSRKVNLKRETLSTVDFGAICEREECPSLSKLVKENRENLATSNMGTLKSATAFLKLLSAARSADKEDLVRAFKGTKNKEILGQLCDLAGAIQNKESHEIMSKILDFDSEKNLENIERYLWSLSLAPRPNVYILKDIFERYRSYSISNEKISETMLLTLASMTNKYYKMPGSNKGLIDEIGESIGKGLKSCGDDECKCKYLRALKNLKCPKTIKTLCSYALEGKKKVSVSAVKALRSFEPFHWSEEVIDTAQRIYFQAGKKFDSSSRTIALDIILESNPSREILQELVLSLAEKDRAFEVKKYLLERLEQISGQSPGFALRVGSILDDFKPLFNNYNVKAQRGLTTAFTRSIAESEYRNASLVSIQELHGGFLKRGSVDVVVETEEGSRSLFTLGLFAGGLSSFASTSNKEGEKDEEEEEEEIATAGMELTVLGTQLRPFIFLTGQGELMGHIWSGTASEKTPAYQAFIVTEDLSESIPLQNGLTSKLKLLGVVSFDLSGQVQISLWNRNAHSLVEKNAGIYVQGVMSVDASFVTSKVEFNVATQVKLNLLSDLNFYNEISLCMQLSQPDSIIKHNIHKVERIPGSKHRLRKSKYEERKIPGRTYALNRKNNEMCNLILKQT